MLKNLFLTGFMGCGKTTVGKVLARRTGYRFVDLDAAIEAEAGVTIKEIFASRGEAAFRLLESAALARVAREPGVIVSTGGGAVIAPENRATMRASGCIVNLTATAEALARRLAGDSERPLLKDDPSLERIATMLAVREVYYADADVRIDTTGKPVQAVAEEVLRFFDASGAAG